jgi:hypothetical protein
LGSAGEENIAGIDRVQEGVTEGLGWGEEMRRMDSVLMGREHGRMRMKRSVKRE